MDRRLEERIANRVHNRAVFVAGPVAQVLTAFTSDVVHASGLRQLVLRMHEPHIEFEHANNRAVCQECTCHGMGCGADYVYWPCDTYKLARDWVDESNERLKRAETSRRDAENEAAQLRAELATVRHERDLLKEERW